MTDRRDLIVTPPMDFSLRITWLHTGQVIVNSDRARPVAEVAAMLRELADGFEKDPKRVG